jgi:hypothetical protein
VVTATASTPGKPRLDGALSLMTSFGGSVALAIERCPNHQRLFRIEAKRNLQHAKEASEEQNRTDQQNHRAGDFYQH